MTSFEYDSPENLQQLMAMMTAHKGEARLVAGGTDMVIKLNKKHTACTRVINLKKVKELNYIKEENGLIHIGAMTTHTQIAASPIVRDKATLLAEACGDVGSVQIRNLGTIGGNIVTSSAAADSVTALIALDAACVLSSEAGSRTVPLAAFFGRNGVAQIQPDEVLIEVFFDKHGDSMVSGFKKLGRRDALAIVVVSIGMIVKRDTDGVCRSLRVSLGGISRTPCRVPEAEAVMQGQHIDRHSIESCLGAVSAFAVKSLEKSPFAHLIPHKKHAVVGIGRDVFYRLFPDIYADGIPE